MHMTKEKKEKKNMRLSLALAGGAAQAKIKQAPNGAKLHAQRLGGQISDILLDQISDVLLGQQ